MANVIKIKRSTTTATPTSLAEGELAYSENSSNLFVGTSGANLVKIGGKADVDKLGGIELLADVTDTINVTAAGALMDSELAGLAAVKATTGTFLTADQTKLDAIEALADVTDAVNVAASGAVMESDTTTALMGFVIDEDNLVSNLDSKVPTQQSVKAYVDTEVASALSSEMTYKGSYDASTNTPNLDATPIATSIGDMYTVTVAGTFFTIALEVGDTIIAEKNSATLEADWTIINRNIDTSAFATAAQGTLADSALQDVTGESIKSLSDVYTSMTPADGQVLTFDTTNGWQAEAAGTGVTDFTALNDTPANFTGAGGFFAVVNAGATALEFVNTIDGGTF